MCDGNIHESCRLQDAEKRNNLVLDVAVCMYRHFRKNGTRSFNDLSPAGQQDVVDAARVKIEDILRKYGMEPTEECGKCVLLWAIMSIQVPSNMVYVMLLDAITPPDTDPVPVTEPEPKLQDSDITDFINGLDLGGNS